MIIGCCRGSWNLGWTSFSLVGLSFFPWPPVGLSSLGLRPRLYNWPPFGLGKKKSNLGKRSSSLVSFLYRPINVLETEYIFSVGCVIPLDRSRFPFNDMEISMVDICILDVLIISILELFHAFFHVYKQGKAHFSMLVSMERLHAYVGLNLLQT